MATEIVPNPYISSFFINTIRITETQTLSSINTIKKQLLYERVSWDTNQSMRYGYTTTESSNFIIKGKASFDTVSEFETMTKKKFSDYFNHRDLKNAGVIALKGIRKAIKILDFINATKTVTSIFKTPEEGLQIPKPSSVVSAMGLISAIKSIPSFGALTPLFMVADVISTKVVNEIINEFTEDSLLAWEQAKQGGLNSALAWVQTQNDGAKMLGLDFIEYISQSQYEMLLNNKFKTFKEFYDYSPNPEDNNKNYYTCFYYVKEKNGRKKYIIDSIILR
ncbi:hypothetical protein [Aquimarina longa]|uniref:hypothetical protein n=1 Tax=Aquimarina longa TaxID=1080221 RepID=UPI000B018792|nr:hypothetical protein [Aquimarina longa]